MMYVIMALDLLGYPPDHPERVEAQKQFDQPAGRRRRASSSSPASRWFGIPESPLTRWASPEPAPGSAAQVRGLAAHQGSPPQGRLVGKAPQYRAVRLVFRIRQRVLSGYRRHRAGAAGPQPFARVAPSRAAGLRETRHPLAARHAIQGRRLGCVRRRQQLASLELCSLRRPQRDARSHVSRYHRARARSAVRVWAHAVASGGPARRRISDADPGSRMEAGTAAGAWITFTARSWLCAGCRRPARAIAKPTSSAALEWLRSIQNVDGGWGESCESYKQETYVPAASTPSQTAWAVLALLAGGDTTSTSLQRWHGLSDRHAEKRRHLGRTTVHRHRIPASVLPVLPTVPEFVPAAGPEHVPSI